MLIRPLGEKQTVRAKLFLNVKVKAPGGAGHGAPPALYVIAVAVDAGAMRVPVLKAPWRARILCADAGSGSGVSAAVPTYTSQPLDQSLSLLLQVFVPLSAPVLRQMVTAPARCIASERASMVAAMNSLTLPDKRVWLMKLPIDGNATVANMAATEIVTSNSTRVKPLLDCKTMLLWHRKTRNKFAESLLCTRHSFLGKC
nr:hypothetical protein [Collimonas humicola]